MEEKYPNLKNPPIVEAIIDIRVSPVVVVSENNHDAKTLWKLYKTKFSSKQISRAAVRYINQMQFDTDVEGLGQYIEAFSTRKFSVANGEMMRENVEWLRKMKNEMFYKSVTQHTIELFNK